jgi:hypothetical protein
MHSDTCKNWANVALGYEENEGYLEDLCNGERYKRLTKAVSKGGAILGCVLATDGICMDKCQFDSQDVGALSCAFIRGNLRDRDEVMISLCTFGKLVFAGKNQGRKAAKNFKATLEHISLRAIVSRFDAFNAGGGALVPMNGSIIHFERAAIVAIYADLPAASKLCLTGSACNTCFLPKNQMADANAQEELRTWANMTAKKREFLDRVAAKEDETATTVLADAKRVGVNLHVRNAFKPKPGDLNVIGPDDDVDNPFAASPPAFLHGMESGTLMKLVFATLSHVVKAAVSHGITETAACRMLDKYCSEVYTNKPHNTNVELGSHALLPMPHGISGFILSHKTLDGNKRITMARLMHGFVASTTLLSPAQRRKHCLM